MQKRTQHLILVVIILFMTYLPKLKAQEETEDIYKDAFSFGLVHSFNMTTFAGSFPNNNYLNRVEKTTLNNRVTADLGLSIDYRINRFTSIQMEALFQSSGANVNKKTYIYNEIGAIEGQTKYTYNLHYLKFPVIFNVYPVENLYFAAGGYVAPLISSKKYEYWYDEYEDIEDINNMDAGIIAGFGFDTKIVKMGFQYAYGITPILNENTNSDIHNSVFQFVLRWKFVNEARRR